MTSEEYRKSLGLGPKPSLVKYLAMLEIELSEDEARTAAWVDGWEDSTIENIISILGKAIKRRNP